MDRACWITCYDLPEDPRASSATPCTRRARRTPRGASGREQAQKRGGAVWRRRIAVAALAVLAWPGDGPAAQTYPERPVRLIVASGVGGGLDFVARLVGPKLGYGLGQIVVVDNRAGASGSIAAEQAARATPDGHTLLLLSASLVVYGAVNRTSYDLFRDFAPVSLVSAAPYLLTVTPGLPVQSVKELVAYARANPDKLNFASTGTATLAHLATEWFGDLAGVRLVHVPYKGVGAALPDLFSGRVQMSFLSFASVYGHVRAGRLKALAVASASRLELAPDIPTVIESGVPGYAVTQWHGLLVPRGTPRDRIERLHRETVVAVRHPEVASRLAADGTEGVASAPHEFAAHLKSEHERWSRIARRLGLQAQ
jgi:tripartite-type tricarboxylate transporter receptor subunit TctC